MKKKMDAWQTPRKCPDCRKERKVNYLWAQKWGMTDDEKQEYKLNCRVCSHTEYTTWDGK